MALKYSGITHIADSLAKKCDITKKEAENRVKDILSILEEELLDPEKDGVQFVDFLTLKKVERKAKLGRNPKNPNEVVSIPAQTSFKAELGKAFKKKLNPEV